MAPNTESFLVEDTHFWIETARISGATVSGLGTLISGAYIGMEIGSSHKRRSDFVALDTPPIVTSEVPGRFFMLKTQDLGSLDRGTPMFFRRLQVGEVVSYELDKDGQSLSVKVFVNAPYDQYVNPDTRFWQASGVDVSLTASGLNVQTQSVLSLLIGGIAFETPATGAALRPADANTLFTLFRDRTRAFEPPPRHPQTFVVVFKQSVRGLAPGAPVEFRGIQIGEVVEVTAQVDEKTAEFSVPVTVRVDAQKLGVKLLNAPSSPDAFEAARRKMIDTMISRGFRAQLRTGNLLTGALFVAFDAFPDAPPATVDWSQTPAAAADHSGGARGDRGEHRQDRQEIRKAAHRGDRSRSPEGTRRSPRYACIRDAHARHGGQDHRAELGAQQRVERSPGRGERRRAGSAGARGLSGASSRVAPAR